MKEFIGFQKGINLGGWLSQCKHSKRHYDSFIKESDLAAIAEYGADHVRLPVDYNLVETEKGEYKEEGFAYIDTCLSWCDKYNLNLILDLHKTAGYNFADQKNALEFFENEELQDRFINLWITFSKRYGALKDRVAFDILNEIVSYDLVEPWNKIAKRTIDTIRLYAPDIKILVGGVCYNSVFTVNLLADFKDQNVVYNFHFYEPFFFTHQSAKWVEIMPKKFHIPYPDDIERYKEVSSKTLNEIIQKYNITKLDSYFFDYLFREAVEAANERNVALYCGEYGVIDYADTESTRLWYRDIHEAFERNNIGRAIWTYKKMNFGITDKHYSGIYEELKSYL